MGGSRRGRNRRRLQIQDSRETGAEFAGLGDERRRFVGLPKLSGAILCGSGFRLSCLS